MMRVNLKKRMVLLPRQNRCKHGAGSQPANQTGSGDFNEGCWRQQPFCRGVSLRSTVPTLGSNDLVILSRRLHFETQYSKLVTFREAACKRDSRCDLRRAAY